MSLVDHEDRAQVVRLVALLQRDSNLVETTVPVVLFDLAAALVDGVGIDGVAHFEACLFGKRLFLDLLVTEIFDIPQGWPLGDSEDDNSAARRALIEWLDVDKPSQRRQISHVALHEALVKLSPGPRLQLGHHLGGRDGFVAGHPHLNHVIRCGRCLAWRRRTQECHCKKHDASLGQSYAR